MKISYYALIACASVLVACSRNHTSETAVDSHGKTEKESDEIVLEPCDAKKFGVKVQEIKPQQFADAIKVSGVIESASNDQGIIVAKSAGIVNFNSMATLGQKISKGATIGSVSPSGITGGDPDKVASVQLNAAKKELDRLTPLYEDGIVSAKDYNAAQAAYAQAKAAYSGHSGSSALTSPQTGVVTQLLVKQGEYVSAGQPVATVSQNAKLVLRADLPQRYRQLLSNISSANIAIPYSNGLFELGEHNGRRITDRVALVQSGYMPVYFTFDNDGTFAPGTNVEVFLLGEPRDGVLVMPVSALSEQQGQLFAYVRIDAEGYEKRPVTVGSSDGKLVEVTSGLTPGEQLVVDGVTFIKLAEIGDASPEGHSHQH